MDRTDAEIRVRQLILSLHMKGFLKNFQPGRDDKIILAVSSWLNKQYEVLGRYPQYNLKQTEVINDEQLMAVLSFASDQSRHKE